MSLVNISNHAMYNGADTVPFLGIGNDLEPKYTFMFYFERFGILTTESHLQP